MADFNPSDEQLETLKSLFGKDHQKFSGLDDIEYSIPTRCESFNIATNYNGLPIGVLMEIHGPEYVGKSAHLLSILADVQRAGHIAAYYELEPATTNMNVESLGVHIPSLITWKHVADLKQSKDFHPRSFEHLSKCTNHFIMNFGKERKSDQCLVIGIDSAVALAPNKQLEEGTNEANYGALTKLYGDWMRSLNTLVCKSGYATVIFTNQEREVIGNKGGAFARTWKMALGPAFHYWFQIRERLTHREPIKSGDKIVGRAHHGEIRKTKRGIDGKKFAFYTKSSMGLWLARELSECGLEHGVITKSGKKFAVNQQEFNSRAELEQYVLTHKKVIRSAIREKVLQS